MVKRIFSISKVLDKAMHVGKKRPINLITIEKANISFQICNSSEFLSDSTKDSQKVMVVPAP